MEVLSPTRRHRVDAAIPAMPFSVCHQPPATTRRRDPGWCVAALALLTLILAGRAPAAEPAAEHQVKAAFLFNFTKFVEWPTPHFATAEAPIVLGVLGDTGVAEALEKVVRDRRVLGRPFTVRALDSVRELRGIDLLFVAAGEERRFDPGDLAALHNAGVLTVGETPRFAALGGIITFERQGDKLRFAIDQAVAGQAGFKLSAQLLQLATTVRRAR